MQRIKLTHCLRWQLALGGALSVLLSGGNITELVAEPQKQVAVQASDDPDYPTCRFAPGISPTGYMRQWFSGTLSGYSTKSIPIGTTTPLQQFADDPIWYAYLNESNRNTNRRFARPPTYSYSVGCRWTDRITKTPIDTFYPWAIYAYVPAASRVMNASGDGLLIARGGMSEDSAYEALIKTCKVVLTTSEKVCRNAYPRSKVSFTPLLNVGPVCHMVDMNSLYYEEGHKTNFCRERGFEAVIGLKRSNGMCVLGEPACPKVVQWWDGLPNSL